MLDVHGNSARLVLFDMYLEQLEDPLRLLIRYQPAGDLGVSLAGDNGLHAFALKAAPKAVDLQSRPGPGPLQRRVALLTEWFGCPRGLVEIGQVEGYRSQVASVRGRQGHNIVAKALDQDLAIGRTHGIQDADERMNRIVDHASEEAGMEVGGRP